MRRAGWIVLLLACCVHRGSPGPASTPCERRCEEVAAAGTACDRETIPEGVASRHVFSRRAGACESNDPRLSACLRTYESCLDSCDEPAEASAEGWQP